MVALSAPGDPTKVVDRGEFPTTTPAETIGQCKEWLSTRKFDALGIATFGPIDMNEQSPTFGYITTTPKPGWKNTDVVGPLMKGLDCPFAFDTDVNAPALAEYMFNSPKEHTSCAYMTVGTGIGVGLVINGKPVHGMMHPEGGHISVPRMDGDTHPSVNTTSPFSGSGPEGMCCSGALAKRSGIDATKLATLDDSAPCWEATAHYLAATCANLVLMVSAERIVLSGGVMQRLSLFPRIHVKMQEMLNGYIDNPLVKERVSLLVVPSKWGNRAGIIGALTLAKVALEGKPSDNKGASAISPAMVAGVAGAAAVCGYLLAKASK